VSGISVGFTPALADRYRIERELGQGGMATVYLAHDLRHDRRVAIKVLRPELAAVIGAERFVREIRTIAALQHPHILGLIDSGEVQGTAYYVMPFVEGESLRDRLTREKQLPIPDAVRIATEVASALDYAHRHGVIHRDIKPENILLHDGTALVADFGIALAVTQAGGNRMTETGMSLGTPHYMSPEQAMGEREITARSDVYALGAVTYEMLTGDPPFSGSTAQAIVAKVLTEKPAPIRRQRERVPESVEEAVLTALEKLPADRFATATEFAQALADARVDGRSISRAARAATAWKAGKSGWQRDRRTIALAGCVLGLAAIAIGLGLRRPGPATQPAIHFVLQRPADLAPGEAFTPRAAAVLPDGQGVVYAAGAGDSSALYVQRFSSTAPTPITRSPRTQMLAVSPDGEWITYGTDDARIWKVPVSGGKPVLLATLAVWEYDLPAWGRDDRIYMGSGRYGLQSVPASGGTLTPVAQPDTARGETSHGRSRRLLGDRLFVQVGTRQGERTAVVSQSGTYNLLNVPGVAEGYVEPGYLLYTDERGLEVVRFDPEHLTTSGPPALVMPGDSILAVSASENGTAALVRRTVAGRGRAIVWVDRAGRATPTGLQENLRYPRLSPDGRKITFSSDALQVWVADLLSKRRVQVAAERPSNNPIWTRDGRRIVYSGPGRPWAMIDWRQADGSGGEHLLHEAPFEIWSLDWSPDGQHLLTYGSGGPDPARVNDIFVVDTAGNRRMIIGGPGVQRNPRFSPDGRWIAYESLETGEANIYVQPWPALDRKWPISTGGGREPLWGPRGEELFYRTGNKVMAVPVGSGTDFQAGAPRELFQGRFWSEPSGDYSYDISPDGRRFLMIEPDTTERTEVRVIVNWGTELEQLLRSRERQ
jgi:serine/threonine-protein kinase